MAVKTRKRMLLVAENVTLAQVVRLVALGRAVANRFEIHFATSGFDPLIFDGSDFARHQLYSLPKEQVFKAMDRGKRLYEARDFARYVAADTELLQRVQPDVVVGDFRLSLSTAAEKLGVRCGTLINAYWSPYARRERFPVPDHPIVRLLGESMTERYFPIAIPKVFAHFAAPLNQVRRRMGLAPVGSLLEMLTHGDSTLYADDARLYPEVQAPPSHVFLGPVLWSPPVPLPPELRAFEKRRPLIYVTLGSSGQLKALRSVLRALSSMDVDVILATAGRLEQGPETRRTRQGLTDIPSNVRCYEYVPGDQVAAMSDLVICNGGSTTGYQALAAGTPVLAVPSNFDQFLATEAMVKAGAAVEVRARSIDALQLRAAAEAMLRDDRYKQNAQRVQTWFSQGSAADVFAQWAATENTWPRLISGRSQPSA